MKPNFQTISITDETYPTLLKNIHNPPRTLYVRGSIRALSLSQPYITIVGTRKATYDGKTITKEIACDLAQKGFVIVSGLALGIDGAAHEGALLAKGTTIAVLGNGIDTIYPRCHERLAERILESGGAIISEYPPGTPAYPNQFLERNRIVSGFSIATIVVEAPARSGSIATAHLALEQGRDVFVIPGPTTHANYRGSHTLIRNGARLAANAEDIYDDLKDSLRNWFPEFREPKHCKNENAKGGLQEKIIKLLKASKRALPLHAIIENIETDPQTAAQCLTFLTMEGTIEEQNGQFIIKK